MCLSRPAAAAPLQPRVAETRPATTEQSSVLPEVEKDSPILKLRNEDGSEETVGADDVKQDTGQQSTSIGAIDSSDPLLIPKSRVKKKSVVSV